MYFMTYCLYLDPSQIMIKVHVMVHQTMNIANKYFKLFSYFSKIAKKKKTQLFLFQKN